MVANTYNNRMQGVHMFRRMLDCVARPKILSTILSSHCDYYYYYFFLNLELIDYFNPLYSD